MAPRRRTDKEKAEVAAFINRLYELGGYETTIEFASRAGLYGSNVGEYLAAKAMPDAYTLLRLMGSVDVQLTVRGKVVDLPVQEGLPAIRPEELSEAVAALSATVEELRTAVREMGRTDAIEEKPQRPVVTRSRATGTQGK